MPVNARTPLSRERVLRAAMSLADTDGLERLTMRRLGAELGVEAMAIYHHCASKSDLLDALADQVAAEESGTGTGTVSVRSTSDEP